MSSRRAADSSDRQLLVDCQDQIPGAIEALVDRHLPFAFTLMRSMSDSTKPLDDVLDMIHDVFIVAFDEAVESRAQSMMPFMTRLMSAYSEALRDARSAQPETVARHVTPQQLAQLRRDLITELRLTIDIRGETPTSWRRAREFLSDLRMLRRSLRARFATLRQDMPIITVREQGANVA